MSASKTQAVEIPSVGVDPDSKVNVLMKDVHARWALNFSELFNTHKFTLPGLPDFALQLGSSLRVKNSTISIMWLFYQVEDGEKKIYKRVEQLVIPFAFQEDGVVHVTLRGLSGLPMIPDFVQELYKAKIVVQKMALTEAEQEAKDELAFQAATLAEEKAQAEDEAAEALAAALAVVVEEKRWKPTGWSDVGEFDTEAFSDTALVLAPGLEKEDLYVTLATPPVLLPVVKAPIVAPPTAVEEAVETEEEIEARVNAVGTQEFKLSEVHSQLAKVYRLLVNRFRLIVSLVVDKVQPVRLQSTVFYIEDIQHQFENHFSEIKDSVLVHIYPLQITGDSDTLWLEKTEVTEYLEIQVPQEFNFAVTLTKINDRFLLTDSHVSHKEEGLEATPQLTSHIARFVNDFKNLSSKLIKQNAVTVLEIPTAKGIPKSAAQKQASRQAARKAAKLAKFGAVVGPATLEVAPTPEAQKPVVRKPKVLAKKDPLF